MKLDSPFLFTILFGILTFVIVPFLPTTRKGVAALVFVLLNAVISSVSAVNVLLGHTIALTLQGGSVFGDIPLRIDPLAAWFILIVNFTCVNGALYGIGYLKPYVEQRKNISLHWCLFVVFHTSMLWVCSLQHGLAFLIAWEIMSVSSFLLVMFDHSRIKTLAAGINYLVQMHIGVACLTVAIVWISLSEGSYDFNFIASFFEKPESIWVFWLLLIGFGIKAGFVPLHTWLPHAHPAAPSHVSGVMSGVIVKMGIYGIIRMVTYRNTGLIAIGEIILVLSLLTAFYGIVSASIHRDFKRMLAFCTIENIGVIGMGIGIGLIGKGIEKPEIMFLGFSAALLHTLNHSIYKSLLFFASGNIYRLTHTRNMEHLGGLAKIIPLTAFFFLCGSLAIGGLPPFNGFVSKFLLYSSLVEGIRIGSFQLNIIMIGCLTGLAVVGGISILTFTKSFGVIFLGTPRTKPKHHPAEVLSVFHIPFFLAVLLMLGIGLFPALILVPVQGIVHSIDPSLRITDTFATIGPVMSKVGAASMLLAVLAGSVYVVRNRIAGAKPVGNSLTWGCGYVAPNSRMQYTGKSFSKTLAKLFAVITGEQKQYAEIERNAVFPSGRSYHSSYAEFFEKNIIDKLSNQILHFMNRFSFIHNGQVQMYVLYGFIFILISLMATFFNVF
jgi:formate hydrogenlyase subunit 3/multisubunit Na+/H+ antiporter MnhD subunit